MSNKNEGKTSTSLIRQTGPFPSEALRDFLRLRDLFPLLRPLVGDVLQFLVVLDASQVQGELRWRVGSRRDPTARSNLQELIESGVVVAVAPARLKGEIEGELPRIASEHVVSTETVIAEWKRFESLIRYYSPRTEIRPSVACPDPGDVAYLQTWDQTGADFIWTRDRHFVVTNPPDMMAGLDNSLRNYARATSILVGVKVGSGFAVVCSLEVLVALGRVIIEGIQRIPPVVKVCIGLAVAGLLLHPKSRERLLGWLKQALTLVERAQPVLASVSHKAIKGLSSVADTAKSAEQTIRAALPAVTKPRAPALVMARAVCLKAGAPLQLAEIERRVRSAGYTTRARNFAAYLKRILRENPEFVEMSAGLWTLHTDEAAVMPPRRGGRRKLCYNAKGRSGSFGMIAPLPMLPRSTT